MKNRPIITAALCAAMLTSCGAENVQEPTEETTAAPTAAASVVADVSETTDAETVPDGSFTDSETVEMYDSSPISDAYLSGDTSELDDIQKTVYDLAVKVIEENVTEDMTDYEKELAIHDYITSHVSYDTDELSVFETHGIHSTDPYGALVDGKCICLGYTSTFRMFMDMLEIPCISIRGKSVHDDGEQADHAWNMVEINGHSYFIDVTWDDPVPDKEGRPVRHKYVNVGEDYMKNKHLWDETLTAHTDSVEDSYIAHNLRVISDESELTEMMEAALEAGDENFCFEPADSKGWDMEKADNESTLYPGDMIKPSLAKITSKFSTDHPGTQIFFQRVRYDGRMIIMGYIIKN